MARYRSTNPAYVPETVDAFRLPPGITAEIGYGPPGSIGETRHHLVAGDWLILGEDGRPRRQGHGTFTQDYEPIAEPTPIEVGSGPMPTPEPRWRSDADVVRAGLEELAAEHDEALDRVVAESIGRTVRLRLVLR